MIVTIHGGHKEASIALPASKSLSHRALIAAALSDKETVLADVAANKDTEATMRVLSHLGASFQRRGNEVQVRGTAYPDYDGALLDCNESGSTLRFLIPLASLSEKEVCFTGHGRLMDRPQSVYEELYRQRHLLFQKEGKILKVKGPLKADAYTVDGSVSSQFISGLLLALPLCQGSSTVTVQEPYESRSYVGLTLDILAKSGIVIQTERNTYTIPGAQHYRMKDMRIPGDDSQMAFFAAKGLLGTAKVEVRNADHDSHQGDHILLTYLRKMGAHIEETQEGYAFYPSQLHGIEMDLADCPDLGPMLFAIAAMAEGTSHFIHAGRLRMKESDRIEAMKEELTKLGCHMQADEDTVTIAGTDRLERNVSLHGHNDHRIVMALSILASLSEGIRINDAEAVNKSYPQFFEDLAKCGTGVDYDR